MIVVFNFRQTKDLPLSFPIFENYFIKGLTIQWVIWYIIWGLCNYWIWLVYTIGTHANLGGDLAQAKNGVKQL
jgi:hypothetical protein